VTIPDIDWSALEDAYGPATDLPGDMRGLVSSAPRKRAAALERLWARLCHQGSVYPASVAAVPQLVDLARSRRTGERHRILELLTGIAIGDHTNFLDGSLSPARQRPRPRRTTAVKTVEGQCHEAVASRSSFLRDLVADRDARVRAAAAFAVAWLGDPTRASSKAIAAQYRKERDPAARVSMLLALGYLGARAERATLERALDDGEVTSQVRAAAAIALAYLDGKKLSSAAREVLDAACVARALRNTAQPWNGGDLAGHAGAILATLPAPSRGRDDAIARLSAVGYIAGDKLAGELVRKVFSGRERKSAAGLTAPQRALLTTILRAGLVRSQGFVEHALKLRGLPPLRDLPAFVGAPAAIHRELRRRR